MRISWRRSFRGCRPSTPFACWSILVGLFVLMELLFVVVLYTQKVALKQFSTGAANCAGCDQKLLSLQPLVVADDEVILKLRNITYDELLAKYGDVMQDGGHYVPSARSSREHLALIIPFRNRKRNLLVLLHNLLPFMWRQQVEFTIFVVEQTQEFAFNKGLLFNVAYLESQKKANITCFIMHDVDLLPMNTRNIYQCDERPRHLVLGVGQGKWPKKLPYKTAFGGAVALRKKHVEAANGFSVSYYGWGLEDDDLFLRLVKKFPPVRYPIKVGKYYRLDHPPQAPNPMWSRLVKTLHSRFKEGLRNMTYTLLARRETRLYTWLLVQPPPPPASLYSNVTSPARVAPSVTPSTNVTAPKRPLPTSNATKDNFTTH